MAWAVPAGGGVLVDDGPVLVVVDPPAVGTVATRWHSEDGAAGCAGGVEAWPWWNVDVP